MPSIDREWVYSQLTLNKTKKSVGDAVLKLLDAWEDVKLSPDDSKNATEIFSKLSMGVSVIEQTSAEEVWVPARSGDIKVGDTVLVRSDAFTGDHRYIHNGRRCRVVAIRYGDIIVNSIDGLTPELVGTHYSPNHLHKLVSS